MPFRDPNNWIRPEIMAPLLSFVLAFLRTIYSNDGNPWSRRFLESTICGLITLSATYGVDAMGVHGDWKYAIAGGIGFLGVDYIRNLTKKFLDKKAGKE